MSFRSPILAGTTLVRDAIQSSNYLAGHAGWQIATSGHAEFNDIVIRGGTTVGGTALFYAGTPAAGTLRYSISDTDGTDAYGNTYSIGVVAYSTGHTGDVGLVDGQIVLGSHSGDFANCASLSQDLFFGGDAVLNTGTGDSDHVDPALLRIVAGHASQPTGSATAPQLQLTDGQGSSALDVLVSGNVLKANVLGTAATWQSAAPDYAAHWAGATVFAGLGGDALAFHLMPDDTLWLNGLATASTGAGTTILTLPSVGGYRPASGTPHGVVRRQSGGAIVTPQEIAVTTAGAVILSTVPANGDVFAFDCRIPLHNIG